MKLHDYQKKMAQHILDHDKCALFADMGLGKTFTVLEAIANLPKPVLIVAPLRVCQSVWQQESIKWGYDYSFSRIMGSSIMRTKGAAREADVYLINVENLVWLRLAYEKEWKWHTIIFDESSLFKTPGSKRTRAALWASRRASNIVLLTGTPAPKSLLDLYSQIKLLDGGARLGRSMEAYKSAHFYPTDYMRYNWAVKPGDEAVINEKLSDICISLSTSDYLDMPEMITNDIYVDLPTSALAGYKKLAKEMFLEFKDTEVTAVNAASLVNKLAQVSSGMAYTDDGLVHIHDAKLKALDDVIEEASGQPVLVVYQYKHTLKRLRERYKNLVELRDDKQVIEDWNTNKIGVLALHPASGGHGLNLQEGNAHIIVWVDQTYNLEHYQQTNARLHRQGQEEPVIMHRLIGMGTIDEVIIQSLSDKSSIQDMLTEGLK